MFESLYDVLNQRYVYKTDIETGVERKMLRLALGPRSQLCPVAEGFKLIVIVDQQKAYDSLDLPLLNRFEKQVLFPRDLLHSQGACLMLQRLSDWCSCILKECGFRTLCDIFCGYYSDTLASLVLNITCYSSLRVIEDRSDHRSGTILLSDAVEQGKELLCRVAFPSAVLLSPTLRADISRIYNLGHVDAFACLKPQSHLFGLLASEFDAKTTSQYLFITTKSPISHFNPAYQAWLRSGENALQETNYRVLQLALISSERQFTSELNDFLQSCNFVQELKDKKTLIILCDPLLCDGALISHAKYLCARRIKEISERKYQRNIVFVIHLPPGVNSRHREFILDVHPPWKYQFVDDIRYTAEISNFSLSDLIEKSAYELYSSSDEFFIDALWGNFHAALARCIAPQQPGTGEVFTIKVVKDLLQAPIFFDYVKSAILECFKVVSEQETDSRLHVNLACSTYENTGGTFREALLLALDCLFLQSFAHVIRTLDVDFNLHCLHHIVMSNIEHSHIYSTWINLAHKVIGKSLSNSFAFLSPTSPDYYANCITRNNSLHGILRCRFPFSERIISAIGNDNVRFQIESVLGAETEQTQLEQMARSISSLLLSLFDGEADGSMLFLFLRMNPMGYLHDFVQIVIPPLPGISDQTYFNILKLIADIHFPSHGYLPSIIQACYWTYERILFHIFSLFSIINIQVRESSLTEFFPFHVDEWILSQISTSRDDSLTEKVVFGLLNCLLQALLTCTNDDIQHFRGFNGIASLLRIVRKVFPHLRMLVRECLLQQPEQDVSRILLPYWRVLYVYLILNECISYFQRHKHDVNKGILDLSIIFQLLQNLLSLHSTASPLDPQMLLSFSAFCCESSKPLLPLTSSLLRTFILEFIQSEHEFIAAITSISPYTTELLETLGILLSTLENSKFLPVRRCILWLLSRLISQDNRQDARKVVSENILSGTLGASEVALMYVNHLEDQISLQTRHNSQVSSRVWTHLAISERNEFLHHLASEGPEIFEYLAFLKISIRRYSFSLSNYLSTTSLSDSEFPPIGNQEVEFVLSESEDARFFLLACLRDLGGNDLLLTYLQRPNNHPYLPTGVKLVTKTKNAWLKLSFLNPFPFILGKEQYLSACDVFKHSVFGNSSSPLLASWLKNHRTRATNFCSLIAAVHTEMGVGDDVSQLTEYLDKMQSLYCNCYFGQVNESDIARTIMNWVLRLDRRDDRTKYEHNLNQLLIHIGIIAIQHPQSLTAAFIEDVSVLNRLYLPGMPQNEMSTLARAMGYVGWYKCPNGHPYTVGEVCIYFLLSSFNLVYLPNGRI